MKYTIQRHNIHYIYFTHIHILFQVLVISHNTNNPKQQILSGEHCHNNNNKINNKIPKPTQFDGAICILQPHTLPFQHKRKSNQSRCLFAGPNFSVPESSHLACTSAVSPYFCISMRPYLRHCSINTPRPQCSN